jgi:hypothetical protein
MIYDMLTASWIDVVRGNAMITLMFVALIYCLVMHFRRGDK